MQHRRTAASRPPTTSAGGSRCPPSALFYLRRVARKTFPSLTFAGKCGREPLAAAPAKRKSHWLPVRIDHDDRLQGPPPSGGRCLLVGRPGQARKGKAADYLDAFFHASFSGRRDWKDATPTRRPFLSGSAFWARKARETTAVVGTLSCPRAGSRGRSVFAPGPACSKSRSGRVSTPGCG